MKLKDFFKIFIKKWEIVEKIVSTRNYASSVAHSSGLIIF